MLVANLALLLLPAAAASGWYCGRKKEKSGFDSKRKIPQDYFIGLNYLINEQPDKAVDVFIKMLDVTSDTVETHLALGSLFRRRGEVDRAIRIHQNLIARPQLDKQQRILALSELAQDYLRAGVLDRAERLFLELVEMGGNVTISLHSLLNIYQQQKDWEQAIATAEKIEKETRSSLHFMIAHYYCEMAAQMREKNQLDRAMQHVKQALSIDKRCVRASLLQAELETVTGQLQAAIRSYQQIKQQDANFIAEMIVPLSHCYERLNLHKELINYLQQCLKEYPRMSVVLVLAKYLRQYQGERIALEFLATQVHFYPALKNLENLIQFCLQNFPQAADAKLALLHDALTHLLNHQSHYCCSQCGLNTKTLYWQCPQCRHWNSVQPIEM